MKAITSHLASIIIGLSLCLSGCYGDDIDGLKDEQSKQAERIAALESWSKTVNSNIEALQSLTAALEAKDYVTGVTQVKQGSEEIGYTISFSKSTPITIYHGKTGDTGETPVIGIKQDTDGKYYWTQSTSNAADQWILNIDGKKIAAEATAPQIRINTSSNLWEISSDGGKTWTSTGVKATGDKGDTGATGATGSSSAAIFSGIDQTNADYVVFNLSTGGSIRLPKYKAFNAMLTDDDAGEFYIGQAKEIDFSLTGVFGSPAVTVKAMNVPQGWKTAVNTTDNKITVTAPAKFSDFNKEAEITFLFSDGIERSSVQTLKVNAMHYQLGDYYPDPNVTFSSPGIVESGTMPIGMVFFLNSPTGGKSTSGKIVSLVESPKILWSIATEQFGINDSDDGRNNILDIERHIYYSFDTWADFPAFEWVMGLNGQTNDYNPERDLWYIPAMDEMGALMAGFNNLEYKEIKATTGWKCSNEELPNHAAYNDQRTLFNQKLSEAGGTVISNGLYFCSDESPDMVKLGHFRSFLISYVDKTYPCLTRAIARF